MASKAGEELGLARVYAAALLDLAKAANQEKTVLDELGDLVAKVVKDAEFARFLTSPTIDAVPRGKSLEKLLRGRYSDLTVDALQVLNRRGRLDLLPRLVDAYRHELSELLGELEVRVETPVPLDESTRSRLVSLLSQKTGKKPRIFEEIDADLLGGLVVRVGDEKFDTTLATKLKEIGKALLERASREIHTGRIAVQGAPA